MTIITFEEALCIFFKKEYIHENVQKLMKNMQYILSTGEKLVYKDDPKKPFLIYYKKFREMPTFYNIYITEEELARRLGMYINYITYRKVRVNYGC